MLLALLTAVNLYSPAAANDSHAAEATAIVAAIMIGFVLVVAGMASVGRRPRQRED
ncbi:hypothetical protein GHK86_08970 [Acidimicrobiaceae bacterium USS-CC1]|uniref:LPXTG cell wall anchor domain-containing protein n=1 Tax=Acidiferrimicrobium australe TaxID=2664430 RepID=A0ABW9QSQ2_9ACTN|nr:hypothetical protein [Acidiferrimicrobium australe]